MPEFLVYNFSQLRRIGRVVEDYLYQMKKNYATKQLSSNLRSSVPAFLVSFSFILLVVLVYTSDPRSLSGSSPPDGTDANEADHVPQIRREKSNKIYSEKELRKRLNLEETIPFVLGRRSEGCNVFAGRWIADNVSYPLYPEESCMYTQPQLRCQEQGRPESAYQHWRWQPYGCELPKFNVTFMLEALRRKRMLFVGDSLHRGQFLSFVCILQKTIPDNSKSMVHNGSRLIFTAKDYNATIEFYWAPLLLESNGDDPDHHRVKGRIVRPKSVSKHGEYWTGADILVFDSYIWWMTGKKIQIIKRGSVFGNDKKEMVKMGEEDAFRLGLEDMARWVDENMDPLRTRIFFTTMSPYHERSEEWGGEEEGNCYNETSPIDNNPGFWSFSTRKNIMQVVHDVFSQMTVPITILNITQLSLYRKDAHTSIYKPRPGITSEQVAANPSRYADCVHWCIPGVPDTWNELLYTKLFYA